MKGRQAVDVILEVAYCSHNSKELSTCHTIAPFSFVEGFTEVRHHLLRSHLAQHRTHPNITVSRTNGRLGSGGVRMGDSVKASFSS